MITLEKQGISRESIDLLVYSQTNCLQNRLKDYVVCFENMHLICSEWTGKPIFWGESEGGMLAAVLAGQMPQTAAVVLFATGGGMKPCEEVKWALLHRMEKLGAWQYDLDHYTDFLNEQIDAMLLDPTPEKQFLGNTYKWWASFLNADEAAKSLDQQSLPICLVHGVKDSRIPVSSADIAAENLSKTNALTYFRLEEFGHDLNMPDIQEVACRWLASVLFDQEPVNEICLAHLPSPAWDSLDDPQTEMSDYVFNRGRDRDGGGSHGDIYGSARFDKDSDGNKKASADIGINHDFGNGCNTTLRGGISASEDKDRNVKSDVHCEASLNYGY